MINLTINKKSVAAEPGWTILEAARSAGVHIPTLCAFPGLENTGRCRVCLVEIEGNPKLAAACTTPVSDGMVVRTHSAEAVQTRRTIVELIVSRHPNDCLLCSSNGDCVLQDLCAELGITSAPYRGGNDKYPVYPIDDSNPFIFRDRDKCVLCGRCVRACDSFARYHAVDFQGRSGNVVVDTSPMGELRDSDCVFCGQCVQVCPVGALVSKPAFEQGAARKSRKVKTICSYCGVGCELVMKVNEKTGRIADIESDHTSPTALNKGRTCVKGRFAWGFVHSGDRLRKPLVREGDSFREATWEEAVARVADGLGRAKKMAGPDAVGFFSSARCTNEENYLLQRLAREVMGTNNVDHCAHL